MASNLLAISSNLLSMALNLIGMASNLDLGLVHFSCPFAFVQVQGTLRW